MALTEGIKFLYGQAGELLTRWRARKAEAAPDATAPAGTASGQAPVEIELPAAAFQGTLTPVVVGFDVLDRLQNQIKDLSKDLAPYAGGFDEVDPSDRDLLDRVDALRLALEAVFGQRLTFVGENRPGSGTPVVAGEAFVREIAGRVAGVHARVISGSVTGVVRAEHVLEGGEAYGVDADVIGPGEPGRRPAP
jgi:hypothetical protein